MSPLVYTMIHNNVYCFIYLRYKLKCKMTEQMAAWAIGEMVKQSPKIDMI